MHAPDLAQGIGCGERDQGTLVDFGPYCQHERSFVQVFAENAAASRRVNVAHPRLRNLAVTTLTSSRDRSQHLNGGSIVRRQLVLRFSDN